MVPRAPAPTDGAQATATIVRGPAPHPLGAVVRPAGHKPFRLRDGKCVLGSATSCDIVISEPGVSRTHAELELVAEGGAVRDLGSRNGTFYLGQRIESAVLQLGATIKLGATPVVIDADTEGLGTSVYAEGTFRGMVGASIAMRRVFATLA